MRLTRAWQLPPACRADSPPCPELLPSACPPACLQLSDLPPHGVLANPATGGVLLALQPSSADAEEEAAAQRAAAPAAAPAAGQQGQGGMEDDDDDMSPRSLAAAVARLAAYTSEEPVGEPVGPQHRRQGLPCHVEACDVEACGPTQCAGPQNRLCCGALV